MIKNNQTSSTNDINTAVETTAVTSESASLTTTVSPPTITFDAGQIGGVSTAVVCVLGLAGDFAFLLFA